MERVKTRRLESAWLERFSTVRTYTDTGARPGLLQTTHDEYEYAPAYSEGPVSELKSRAYFGKTGRDAGVEDCIQRRLSSTAVRTQETKTPERDGLLR